MSSRPAQRPDQVLAWLNSGPSFEDLCAAFPDDWKAVQREIADVVARSDTAELEAYVARLAAGAASGSRAERRGGGGARRLSAEVRRQLAMTALRKHLLAVATGVESGTVRFGLVNGYVAQRLMFRRDLERKPVSMRWFRIVWPLLRQRGRLMPLVQPKGIYCFYSRPLVARIATLVGGRSCLEIAAGDGTLSRFLRDQGVEITATDNFSWQGTIAYPEGVVREDAQQSLRRRQPQVVICSWPPAANPFERHVFTTPSVELYIVIGSRHRFGFGDWKAYEAQTTFEFEERLDLAQLVLPPEIEPGVYVFRRRETAAAGHADETQPDAGQPDAPGDR